MSRSADIRLLLAFAPSTGHELADLLGITLRSAHVGLWVLQKQRHVRKSGRVVQSGERGKPRNLYELTARGKAAT